MALDTATGSAPRLLTIDQVADLCQVSTKTVYRAIRSGALKACRLGKGGAYRVKPEEMESWIEACSGAAAAPPSEPSSAAAVPPQRTRGDRRSGGRTSDKGRLRVAPGMGRTS
jgi:excisionase family DNA binding protein